jgi:predicted flap endonuclease-1-like 5' DNA nuclease
LTAVAAIPTPASAPVVDLKPILIRLNNLDAAIQSIHIPEPVSPDLTPVLKAVAALQIPQSQELDLSEVNARLEQLEALLHTSLSMPPPGEHGPAIDLSVLLARLDSLENTLRSTSTHQTGVMPLAFDLTPTEARLAAIEQAVHNIAIRTSMTVDLAPLMQKLMLLEAHITLPTAPQHHELPTPAPTNTPVQAEVATLPNTLVRNGSSNLLTHAAFGTPDDLKLIKGVGEVLEKMLYEIGVYYFWQIAEWTPQDVADADAKLPVFKGRIDRDQWITQSQNYATAPFAARKPTA